MYCLWRFSPASLVVGAFSYREVIGWAVSMKFIMRTAMSTCRRPLQSKSQAFEVGFTPRLPRDDIVLTSVPVHQRELYRLESLTRMSCLFSAARLPHCTLDANILLQLVKYALQDTHTSILSFFL